MHTSFPLCQQVRAQLQPEISLRAQSPHSQVYKSLHPARRQTGGNLAWRWLCEHRSALSACRRAAEGKEALCTPPEGYNQPSHQGVAGGAKTVTSAEEPWGFTKREGFRAVCSSVNGISVGDVGRRSASCSASSSSASVGNHRATSEPLASLLARGI